MSQLAGRGQTTYCLDGQVYTAASAVRWMEQLGYISHAADLDVVAAEDNGGVIAVPAAQLRPAALAALDVSVAHCGAILQPHQPEDAETIARLFDGARTNGVQVSIRDDGALLVPGESVTDPVAFTHALTHRGCPRRSCR